MAAFDLIVNMSGRALPTRTGVSAREWKVEDPIGRDEPFYIAVRDLIEMKVMRLILELRREANPPEPRKRSKRSPVRQDN